MLVYFLLCNYGHYDHELCVSSFWGLVASLLVTWVFVLYHLGKGTYKWKATGALYDGDWKEDKRNGFGTYSIPTEDGGYTKQYSGGWKDNKKHVCLLLRFLLFFTQ